MNKIFLFATAALALTACSNDGPDINGGEAVAARVTANINGPQTRAYNQTWESADAIGISTTSTGKTKYANMKYSTTGDGNFTHVGGDATGIFFQNIDEVTFSAYYPFAGNENTEAGTIADVTTENQANQKQFDFLFASGAKASRSSSTLSFTGESAFSHRMTRLVINLVTDANSGFTAGDVTSGTYHISGLRHSGTFNTSTGEAIATGDATADWTITAQASDADNVRKYSMILYPQTDSDLTLRATVDGVDYTCNITPALESGKSYTYTITVKKTGLDVGGCTISDWQDGGSFSGDATIPMPDPQVGDYYYSDGTYSTILDPSKQTIGVVFYAGKHPDDQSDYTKSLTTNGAYIRGGKVRGYAVALDDATDHCKWGQNHREIGCFPKGPDGSVLDNASNPQIDWSGYEWTQKIIAAAGGIDRLDGATPAGYPAAYYTVVAYQNSVPAPEGSSGWFLPSVGQMVSTGSQKDKIVSAGGSPLTNFYQSSSEDSEDPGYIVLHAMLHVGKPTYYTKENSEHPARAILAF